MSRSKQVWAGAALLALLQLAYMLLWWNKGIQLNSNGLGQLASLDILAGKAPYLDFHYWCPPGHLLVYTALTWLFGDGLIYVRGFAVVERLAIFVLLYFWLTRVVSPGAAFFGTFAAAIGFSADPADVIAHYDFDAVLASVAAGFAASVALTTRHKVLFFVTGVCAGLCMVAKQTQGVGMFLIFPVIFLLARAGSGILLYLVGWALPTGLTAAWLMRAGAWHAFIEQSFTKGTSSKGPLGSILLRPFYQPLVIHTLGAALAIALVLIGVHWWLARREEPTENPNGLPWMLWSSSLAALLLGFAAAWWVPYLERFERVLFGYGTICIFVSLFGNLAVGLAYTWKALQARLDDRSVQIWILASVSATTAYMFSLSWAAYEKMLIPGFAVLIALALNGRIFRPRQYAAIALGLILICTCCFRKLMFPYGWENWTDGPIKIQTVSTDFPELKGIQVSERTAQFLEGVTRTIDAHSKPDDKIFCFPNYALFYVLAHRQPAVFAYMDWFDIVSDAVVMDDAARIKANPPAVILSVEMPELVMSRAESKFRNGKPSGQRAMLRFIKRLPGYRLLESVPIPYEDFPLNIYVRD
jgi:hypothetical protein